MVKIVDRDDPVLREIAREVPPEKIKSPEIQDILGKMKIALKSQDDGVAIAAPQIGESLRIFIVSGRVSAMLKKDEENQDKYPDIVFINPVITKFSKEKKFMEEGCLSVRYLYGKVKRSTRVHIESFDENGTFSKRGASGLLAQIYQHETDHLNGVLFIDTAENLEDMPPEKLSDKAHNSDE